MNDIVCNDNCELPDYYAFVRQAMANVQGAIDGGEIAQGHEVLTHHFAQGVYGRQMDVTANTLVISKMHRHQTLNVFLKGRVSLISPDGGARVNGSLCTCIACRYATHWLFS